MKRISMPLVAGLTLTGASVFTGWTMLHSSPSPAAVRAHRAGDPHSRTERPVAPSKGRVATEPSLRSVASGSLAEAARLTAMPESIGRQAAITAFVATLTDPADCAAIAGDLATYGHALVGAALRRWVELDPRGAIRDYALTNPDRQFRLATLAWMMGDYAQQQDAQAAFAYAKQLAGLSETERDASVAATLSALAKVDPATASAALRALPAAVAAGPSAEIYAEFARQRPAAEVFAEASDLPGAARAAALQAVLKVAAANDLESAVGLWHDMDNAALRHDLTRALADGFRDAGVASKEVADWLFQNVTEPGAASIRAEALSRLAEVDPSGAKVLIAQRTPSERDDLSAALASMLEPAAGLDFARQITREEQRQTAMAEVANRMGSSDPTRLYQEVGRDDEFARVAMPAVIDALAYEAVSSATDYVQALPSELRNEAASRLVERVTDLSPERAMALAADLISEPEARRLSVASAFAATVGGRAGAALEQLPELPAGVERDPCFASVVPLIAFRNPDAAWAVASAIGDEGLRVNALQEVVLGIARMESPQAALQRLASAGLPREITQQIRDHIK